MTISAIVGDLETAQIVYELQNYLIFVKKYVRRDEVKNYCDLLMQSLSSSKLEIDNSYRKIQVSYPYLINRAALHSADRAKENLLDTLSEIESTMKVLDNAIKSIQ